MNYYEHHIRDYDAATAHLSWDEDMAYTRLMRWYYRKEQPIPADVKEACRQVRATTKVQRDAVAAVLNEFFVLQADGWHQETCDEAIATYQAGEPERVVKKANEDNRLRRHREERARLFKILTDAGEHAPWNIRMEDLRAMVGRISGGTSATAPETEIETPATAPATPATATQSPDTRHQTPVLKEERDSAREAPPVDNSPDYLPDPTPCGALAKALRAQGLTDVAPGNPVLRAWVDKGLTAEEAFAGLETARKARGAPSPMTWAYLARVLETQREKASAVPDKPDQATPKPAQDNDRWWMSENGIDRKGRELGMFARGGESYPAFKDRIFEALRQRGAQEQAA
ncbi:YdaU family protein [Achromobacter xylosoxidans]|uniref:YdaU family protein n=1 Tax=Alcaligenes xylosoxydans xylosoxydans TaxID=85698 RepID=UPI002040527A|nr:YdaU family protein [Achromobacter xylosoxidans]MCM2575135.1 YdaU family protein [Achromobacter xylosoxidans]